MGNESILEAHKRTLKLGQKADNMPELKAVGNPTGVNQYTPEDERKGYEHNNSTQRGTSATYRARKLKRDHADVFVRILDYFVV